MDDRQRDIVEGAGLQESRLNTEFIDWLNKWGSTILMIVLVAAVAWAGYRWWERRQVQALDNAFVQLEAARQAGSPDNLVAVAKEHPERGAVFEIASCQAAEIYLEAARRGVAPGGTAGVEEDLIDEEQKGQYLDRAEELFQSVLDRVEGRKSATFHEMRARSGLVAVSLTRGDLDEGRQRLEQAIALAEEHGFEKMATWNRERLEELDTLANQPPLFETDDLAAAWEARPPEGPDSGTLADEMAPMTPATGAQEGGLPSRPIPQGEGAGQTIPMPQQGAGQSPLAPPTGEGQGGDDAAPDEGSDEPQGG